MNGTTKSSAFCEVVSLSFFPPTEPSTSSFLSVSTNSPSCSFASLRAQSSGSSSPRSPTSSQPASPSLAAYHLNDFETNSYRDIVNKWTELFTASAIKENSQLRAALQNVLKGSINPVEDMKSIVHFFNKTGGLLGHRNDLIMSDLAEAVMASLNIQSIPQRVKEIQAIQLMFEALIFFPHELIPILVNLTSEQRQKLLKQFQSTPLGTNVHSFCEKGAWSDPMLVPILEHCGYKLANSRLQLHRTPLKKDFVRTATMATLSIEYIFA